MNAVAAFRPGCCCTYRWAGRVSAALIFFAWVAFVILEPMPLVREGVPLATQAALLAVIFGGYAISLRHERAGAVVSLLGVAAFFVATRVELQVATQPAFGLFALPPVLFLISQRLAEHESHAAVEPPAEGPPAPPAAE